MIRRTFQIEETDLARAQDIAAKMQIPMAALVRMALRRFLDEVDGNAQPIDIVAMR